MSDYVTEVHKEGNKTSNFFHIDYLVLCEIFKNLLCKLTSKINYCYKNIQWHWNHSAILRYSNTSSQYKTLKDFSATFVFLE